MMVISLPNLLLSFLILFFVVVSQDDNGAASFSIISHRSSNRPATTGTTTTTKFDTTTRSSLFSTTSPNTSARSSSSSSSSSSTIKSDSTTPQKERQPAQQQEQQLWKKQHDGDDDEDSFIKRNFENQERQSYGVLDEGDVDNESIRPLKNEKNLKTTTTATATTFPFSLVVNHETVKQALLVAAINPRLGRAGVLIGGGHGTCKSVLAKSCIDLFPSKIPRTIVVEQQQRQQQQQQQKEEEDGSSPSVSGDTLLLNGEPEIHPQLQQLLLAAKEQPLELDPFLLWELIHDNENPNMKNIDGMIDSLWGVEHIPMPFVTVPVHVMEEDLLGSIDIEKSIKTGQTEFSPGLLAKAHRGILYIDDIHLLDDNIIHCLLNAIDDRKVTVEREGISIQYPCRPALVIATHNPDEGDLAPNIKDRFAMTVSTDHHQQHQPLTIEQRVQVVQNVEAYQDRNNNNNNNCNFKEESQNTVMMTTRMEEFEELEQARSLLPDVRITHDQMLYLCEETTRADCEGQRGELMAVEIAKTIAALQGRTYVTTQDLKHAVWMAIVPRANVQLVDPETTMMEEEQQQQQQQPPELQPIQPDDPDHIQPDEPKEPEDQETEEEKSGDEDDSDESSAGEEPDDDNDTGEEEQEDLSNIPTEFMFGPDFDVPIDPLSLLDLSKERRKKGKGGKHSKIFGLQRGRMVKAILPKTLNDGGRLAIGATLRASAPHQKARRERRQQLLLLDDDDDDTNVSQQQQHTSNSKTKVHVTKDDFRIQKLARKAGSLIIFVVDASGSMALNRMGAAKGAAVLLLKEAYQSRDKIALIEFHGQQAQVLVPPTKSMSLTKNRLESLPCGGGSPLSHALETSIRLAANELKVKKDVGHVVLVLLTDGRANVPLSASHMLIDNNERGGITTNDNMSSSINTDDKSYHHHHQFISSDRKALKEEVVALTKQLAMMPNIDLLCIDTEDQFVGTGIAKDIAQAGLGTYQHLAVGAADTKSIHQLVQQELRTTKK